MMMFLIKALHKIFIKKTIIYKKLSCNEAVDNPKYLWPTTSNIHVNWTNIFPYISLLKL